MLKYSFSMAILFAATFGISTVVEAAPLPRPAGFAACVACHQTKPGVGHGIGPNLWGIGGRTAGSYPNFKYSTAMQKSQIKWTRASLAAFIAEPRKTIPGNRMAYAGQRNPKVAEAVADYLMSLK